MARDLNTPEGFGAEVYDLLRGRKKPEILGTIGADLLKMGLTKASKPLIFYRIVSAADRP